MIELITEATNYIRSRGVIQPEIGIILGTGLGRGFIREIQNQLVLDYKTIPHFPVSTVESHSGELIYGDIHGKKILAMRGRTHYYEGYSMQQVTLPVRTMKMLGVKNLLISNAAGNLNRAWKKGELMLLDDHINLQTDNPLRGKNLDSLGPRFPDMSQPYSRALNTQLMEIAKKKNIILNEGIYACVVGPNLETRAEYRFLQRIGADAIGMSTVPEVIVANHMAMPCCAISVLTDDCDPDNLKPASIAEIIEIAEKAEPTLTALLVELIKGL
jgi:purine-nucleoside phosphorylase